ncbi:MAG: hypothetical protein ACTTIO_00630 [Candidatus Fimenecus sp.]
MWWYIFPAIFMILCMAFIFLALNKYRIMNNEKMTDEQKTKYKGQFNTYLILFLISAIIFEILLQIVKRFAIK